MTTPSPDTQSAMGLDEFGRSVAMADFLPPASEKVTPADQFIANLGLSSLSPATKDKIAAKLNQVTPAILKTYNAKYQKALKGGWITPAQPPEGAALSALREMNGTDKAANTLLLEAIHGAVHESLHQSIGTAGATIQKLETLQHMDATFVAYKNEIAADAAHGTHTQYTTPSLSVAKQAVGALGAPAEAAQKLAQDHAVWVRDNTPAAPVAQAAAPAKAVAPPRGGLRKDGPTELPSGITRHPTQHGSTRYTGIKGADFVMLSNLPDGNGRSFQVEVKTAHGVVFAPLADQKAYNAVKEMMEKHPAEFAAVLQKDPTGNTLAAVAQGGHVYAAHNGVGAVVAQGLGDHAAYPLPQSQAQHSVASNRVAPTGIPFDTEAYAPLAQAAGLGRITSVDYSTGRSSPTGRLNVGKVALETAKGTLTASAEDGVVNRMTLADQKGIKMAAHRDGDQWRDTQTNQVIPKSNPMIHLATEAHHGATQVANGADYKPQNKPTTVSDAPQSVAAAQSVRQLAGHSV